MTDGGDEEDENKERFWFRREALPYSDQELVEWVRSLSDVRREAFFAAVRRLYLDRYAHAGRVSAPYEG